jgi:hypothetical protein
MGHRVLASLGSAIASDPGDPILNAAILAWNAQHVPWTDAWFQFPIFHPTADAITLSEHLLGISVIASPIYWVTGSAAVAYNLTLLLSFPLCGMAMYALVWRLTRSAPAAFLAGLAFAFAPYRVSQLPHIQMLTVFWAPLALLGLHGFLDHEPPSHRATEHRNLQASESWWFVSRRLELRWLTLFAACWALQGAANGYLLVYFSILVAVWVLWFLVSRRRWRDAALLAAAAAIALLPLVPILYRYVAAHRRLGLARNLGEIAAFGADIGAPLCAPDRLTFWGWMRVTCAPEGELFAGAAIVALCIIGVAYSRRAEHHDGARSHGEVGPESGSPSPRRRASAVRVGVRRLAVAMAAVFLAMAISIIAIGPWRIDLGWLRASASDFDKPLSTALAFLLVGFLLSDRFRRALARGSAATFYAGAAFVCWVLSWGPFPRIFGLDALYQAPYAWLLQLPGVDGLRVPARFWMMTVLCLSVVAGLTVARLLRGRAPRTRAIATTVVGLALLIDGWTIIPVAAIPPPIADAESLRGAPVAVLPVGDAERDIAAVYHAVAGRWRSINGYSGYAPPYYDALRTLSQAGDPVVFEPFLRREDIHVVDNGAVRRVPARYGARASVPLGQRLTARVHDASCSREEVGYAIDGDMETRWVCGMQNADHEITVDLGRVARAGAVVHALGSSGADFPRHLVIETSSDLVTWAAAWEGSPAAAVLEEALAEPTRTGVVIAFPPREARYVRLRQIGRQEAYWSIAELEIWSGEPRG